MGTPSPSSGFFREARKNGKKPVPGAAAQPRRSPAPVAALARARYNIYGRSAHGNAMRPGARSHAPHGPPFAALPRPGSAFAARPCPTHRRLHPFIPRAVPA